MATDPVLDIAPLSPHPWQTVDPFLFCVHHVDAYPQGNEAMGPAASLAGRQLGMDFDGRDGWSMYHGRVVPGFPQHPHRGFETVTIARRGMIDHSDSLGATARFGAGDVQWMTAGSGVVHAEMFPLTRRDAPNPVELFQIWVNLPRADKMAEPHFTMLWADRIPRVRALDEEGRVTEIDVIAGSLDGRRPPAPPPRSWAARPASDFAIWTLKLAAGARFVLPAASEGTLRTLYLFVGTRIDVAGRAVPARSVALLRADVPTSIVAGPEDVEVLMLQARPIGEPVAQMGPFVMNTRAEIQTAYVDYERTRFGGWPWPADDPVHARDAGRFAVHVDGRREVP